MRTGNTDNLPEYGIAFRYLQSFGIYRHSVFVRNARGESPRN
jgi:hypothetical protein